MRDLSLMNVDEVLECLKIAPAESLPVADSYADMENASNFELYRVEEVTYEKTAPRKEALENVVSALRMDGVNFIYLLVGDKEKGVSFYFGVSRDVYEKKELDIAICDIAERILKTSILGNFRGSSVKKVDKSEKKAILNLLSQKSKYKCVRMMQGIPGINKDDEEFQAVNRLVDVMQNDNFAFMLIAKPLQNSQILDIENEVYELYSQLASFSKMSQQGSFSQGSSEGASKTVGESSSTSRGNSSSATSTESESRNTTKGSSYTDGTSHSSSNGHSGSSSNSSKTDGTSHSGTTNKSTSNGTSVSHATTKGVSENKTLGSNKSKTENVGKNTNTSTSFTIDKIDKRLQDWQKYWDEVLLPRLDYSKGKGLFVTSALLLTENPDQMQELQATLRALYSGESGNKNPLLTSEIKDEKLLAAMSHFQLPHVNHSLITGAQKEVFVAYSRSPLFSIGNLYSARELSLIAGLPQKEVRGLPLRAEVEFGLNSPLKSDGSILMGNLVQSGNVLETPVYLEKENLDKHVFVTGVTGSGKTTTCQRLLIESGLPFCVIEPAKTEYRVLKQKYPDLLVFTLGDDSVAPFRLNPFELLPGESLSSHVDMLKACFEASFDMEAAIPQIVEAVIYKIYADKGWNERTEKNTMFANPYANGVRAFPVIDEFIAAISDVVKEQGFDERLKDEYIGSIKARFQSLTHGSKGKMLNTSRSVDFEKLLDGRVVLELEPIKNPGEKALVMGFILSSLGEVIKRKYKESSDFKHITLVEEAHRLLSKWMPGDSMNKKQSVEAFADMLAEVRKYGECLIIADQIPNKLTPDVLKNTNTKIVHRLFAQDDKEAIGNTMALGNEQKDFLSSLETGRAIMFSQGAQKGENNQKSVKWNKPVQIKVVCDKENDTGRKPVAEKVLRETCLQFHAQQILGGKLKNEQLEVFADEILSCNFAVNYMCFLGKIRQEGFDYEKELNNSLGTLLDCGISEKNIALYVEKMFYSAKKMKMYSDERVEKLVEIITSRQLKGLLNDDLFEGGNN